MSRRAPKGPPAREQGWVYTLHLVPPLKHARHYTGFKKAVRGQEQDVAVRLAVHEAGQGAKMLRAQRAAGGTWQVANVEPGTRDLETTRKERGATRRCPVCIGERQAEPEAGA